MVVGIHHLFLLFTLGSCESNVTQMIEMTQMRNKRHTDESAGITTLTSSLLRCAVQCSDTSCLSLSYHAGTKSCRVFDFLITNDTSVSTSESGWKSYQKNSGADCPAHLGYIYNDNLDWCYRLVTGLGLNVPSALSTCGSDGAHLIRINSVERQNFITSYLLSNSVNSIYIGGHSENRDNNFVYEDGTPLPYTSWDTNQPVNQERIYIELKGAQYVWANGHGTMSRDFMCEI
ncbi:macrophage mannose receptor 1-like [Argopecten irradians]|uniref:macrophage mannose receptor 1-like n=1 Tax=Argopecten irradians TaxID=31199 RepID=UPI0037136CD7